MNKSTVKNRIFDVYWNRIAVPVVRRKYLTDIRRRFDYENKFSLLTSNCIGGELYNDLGLRFTSPTINLWFPNSDFLKLAANPSAYLSKELVFVENERFEAGGGYPKALLGDVQIYFEHYHSQEEAADKWYERCQRVNYENLYIIMADMDVSDEDIEQYWMDLKCKRKTMFTTNPQRAAALPDVYQIKMYEPYSYVTKYAVKRWNGFYDFEKFFDFVAWLNGEEGFFLA